MLPADAGLGAGATGLAVGTGGLAAGLPPGTVIFPLQCGHWTVFPALDFITRLALPQFEQATNMVSGLPEAFAAPLELLAAADGVAGFGTPAVGFGEGATEPVEGGFEAAGTSFSV